ncbi:MAG: putative 3-hydroxyphenylpropionic transporter MhpT [Planctomycetaceae bacterium]|nr:putative 3-hydroxyphenylpropionic transporter MhpT [Planctomycetaceae bacterium]
MSTLVEPAVVAEQAPQSLVFRIANFGWLTILVGAIAMAATYPGRTHGLGMVTEPLLKELHMADPNGRVFYASLNLWGTLIGAMFCLPVGWLFDRLDRRLILAGNLILLGLSVLWMSTIETWQQLFLAIILTRGLGQSALSVVSITIVGKSFDAYRIGIAMACYSIVSTPFHLILIKGIGWALTDGHADWRTVWGWVGVSLIILSLTALLLKRPPKIDVVKVAEGGSTFVEALSTPAFWVFSLTISIWGMIYAGISLFNVDIFKERGFDEKVYFNILASVSVIGLTAKLFFGWLVNYVRLTSLLAACLLLTAVSLCGLPFATQVWHAYAYAVCLGIASGAVALLFFATWGKLYGRRELGRIQGVAQMLTVFASASGPLLVSLLRRATASYSAFFFLMAALTLVMAVIAWFTPLPRPRERTPEPE